MRIIKSIFISAIVLSGMTVKAQEEIEEKKESKTTYSASVDLYTKYEFGTDGQTSYTSFTSAENSFDIGMASIKAEHEIGKVAGVIDLGFGQRAEDFAGNGTIGTGMAIKQAYVSYAPTDWVNITGGTFGTHIGYELLDAADNRNYSMSYAFSYGPFLNTGIKADFSLTDNWGLMAGVSLPTDYRTSTNGAGNIHTDNKALIGQLSYSNDNISLYLSQTTGSNNPTTTANTSQTDFVGDFSITDKFGIGVNLTHQIQKDDVTNESKSWNSGVVYVKFDANEKFNLTLRSEYYNDTDGISAFEEVYNKDGKAGASVISETLSANIILDNLIIIPEIRADLGSENMFMDEDGKATKTSAYFLLAAAYSF